MHLQLGNSQGLTSQTAIQDSRKDLEGFAQPRFMQRPATPFERAAQIGRQFQLSVTVLRLCATAAARHGESLRS
jgi:hypothetical protein